MTNKQKRLKDKYETALKYNPVRVCQLGHIIDGHHRNEVARQLGIEVNPKVEFVDHTDPQVHEKIQLELCKPIKKLTLNHGKLY